MDCIPSQGADLQSIFARNNAKPFHVIGSGEAPDSKRCAIHCLLVGESKHGEFPSETVKVGNVTREYRLVAPKSVDLSKPAPG